MRYELARYFQEYHNAIIMRPKSFKTGEEVSPYQGGPEALFAGDSLDDGMPKVGTKFILSNRFLPVMAESERVSVITSPVVWVGDEFTYPIAPAGTFQHNLDFRTKYSEYRLTWITR